jgi:hypothetical protein
VLSFRSRLTFTGDDRVRSTPAACCAVQVDVVSGLRELGYVAEACGPTRPGPFDPRRLATPGPLSEYDPEDPGQGYCRAEK